MNKSILWLIGLLFVTSLSVVSCSETDGVEDPYANWEERNQRYIDSIATVAEANQGNEVGQWKIIRSYKLPPLGLDEKGKVNDNVYCEILEVGDGTVSPLFTDSVDVHYRGQLIPLNDGQIVTFDQSYQGELDLNAATSVGYKPSGVVTGWTSALQEMKAGDRWKLYIPYNLGYGESGYSSIPGYSILIFDLYLEKVIPLRGSGKAVDARGTDAE
ncbi:FKBP-type peptidyl-prolyl cis-trans isomerase [Phocaeicola sartorii]|uniref:FKBP-type peptidyl-prolyl cis-trans isomerase n=1 Tax=Phocaeicola sartorii TaxID=671267 RepID=UPI00266EFCFA|nr:FKBP-type peptidyl-prolyl cis-trans isomerase [Phocaeicola sartorii]